MAGKGAYQLPTWVPDDLVYDIFCRLPVQSLMRFKCINKSCFNMIEDPNFISRHLHIFNKASNNRNGNIRLLLVSPTPIGEEFTSLFSFDSETNTCSLNFFDLSVETWGIMGPCNGIYCLVPYEYGSILFINPAMREYMAVPDCYDQISPPGTMVFAGFGFDPKTNDYKIVQIIHQRALVNLSEPLGWHAMVYTLSSNSWRKVTSPLPPIKFNRSCSITGPVFVQGATHWLFELDSVSENKQVILAFDMVDDVFKIINIKVELHGRATPTIAKFKESLAVIFDRLKCLELWVMKEYGSWTKHLIIEPIPNLEKPLAFCEEDRSLLFEYENGILALYDLQSREVMNLGYKESLSSIMAAVYEESLISLRRGTVPVSIFNMIPQQLFRPIYSALTIWLLAYVSQPSAWILLLFLSQICISIFNCSF